MATALVRGVNDELIADDSAREVSGWSNGQPPTEFSECWTARDLLGLGLFLHLGENIESALAEVAVLGGGRIADV